MKKTIYLLIVVVVISILFTVYNKNIIIENSQRDYGESADEYSECVAIWSNCDCTYKAYKIEDVDYPRTDCDRECTNEFSTDKPQAMYIGGICTILRR